MPSTHQILAILLLATACSSESSEPRCAEYAAGNIGAEPVAFEQHVLPIFQRSCGLNALCHGLPTNLPFLGSNPPLESDASAVWAAIVDRPAGAIPSRSFVEPGSPENSFLMRKMDGDQCIWDDECRGGSCGAPMPEGSALLAPAERDVVRTWISRGAPE